MTYLHFIKRSNAIVGANGSGKSNVIDALLFVFGYRSAKLRTNKLAVLIHKSEQFSDLPSTTVSVFFRCVRDVPIVSQNQYPKTMQVFSELHLLFIQIYIVF